MRKEFELSSIIQPAQSMDEELERTILGCMAISAVNPLRFIVQEDQTVAIYAGRRLLTQMNIGLFARLSPQEILREVGIPINDMAAKA
jgi:hypothetical protein